MDVLKNFQILVTDKLQSHTKDQDQFFNKNNFSVCATQGEPSLAAGEVRAFPCEAAARGRYVVIAKRGPKDEQFPLCEVEVYNFNSYRKFLLLLVYERMLVSNVGCVDNDNHKVILKCLIHTCQ